ncbi:MAG: SDR family NAD(P)-dependent oxidoreductase [Pseudomonadales bacterium]|nr:SDR family NAD(P)-dependent oxidoreductase [Pseudomonadales bacterium]
MSVSFDNRVAVVTGAGSGLGRAHAQVLAARGVKVVVNDLGGNTAGEGGSTRAADDVVKSIVDAGGEAVANYDSVASLEGGQNIVKTAIDNFGGVDIVINNAGNVRDKSFAKMDLDNFTAIMDVHLMGAVYVTKAAWPLMLENKFGRVVMTSSSAGLFGSHGHTNYGSAKISLIGFMNALIQEGSKKNVLVNSIAPMALTRMTEEVMSPKLAPMMQPEFVSAMVAFLCSDECDLSGQIVECGMGYYSKVQIVEGAGVLLGGGEVPSPEEVQANWGAISDMSEAKTYRHAGQVIRSVFNKMKEEGVLSKQ